MSDLIEAKYKDRLYNMIKKFAFVSRDFCDKYCVPDGLMDIMKFNLHTNDIPNNVLFSNKLSYDYDYYAFTKSTKTLHAIWSLLKDQSYNFNEDSLILVRSIFENHIMSRYLREHINIEIEREKVIKDFVKNPLGVSLNYYTNDGYYIKNLEGDKIGKINMPSKYKMGKEKDYYKEFYSFLCEFAHCSFGRLDCYFDGALFYYSKNNFKLETMLFTIFVFTKIFEGVVTVEGENFASYKEEKNYYDLVYDSLELQEEVFDYLIGKYERTLKDKDLITIQLYLKEENIVNPNNKMKSMLIKMKGSLLDNEIGSVCKLEKDKNGKFVRKYPTY